MGRRNQQRLEIYVDSTEYDQIRDRAEALGLNMSAFVRMVLKSELARSQKNALGSEREGRDIAVKG